MASAPTFVLVHGGMHGGWCWRRVARRLRAVGAEVFTPTLTGLGERAHLNSPQVDLALHVEDVVQCIESEELSDVVLVGHSYGGMVITGVADRLFARIAQLVYLDALVPDNGQSAIDVMGGSRVPEEIEILDVIPNYDFGVSEPDDIAWVRRRATPQSALTIRQKLQLKRDLGALSRHFIACTYRANDPPVAAIARVAKQIKADPSWRYREIAAGHDAMVSAPEDVANELLAAAEWAGVKSGATTQSEDLTAPVPSHVPAHMVKGLEFNFGDRPHEKLDRLHQGPPIFYTPHHIMHSSMGARSAGTWVITRAADMRAVLTDPATYTSVGLHNFGKALGETWELIPLEQDPPEHTKYRAIINQLFTQKRLNELDAKVRVRAETLLNNCKKLERFDFLMEFSYPFPASVFVDMVGMRVEDTATFLAMVHRMQRSPTMEDRVGAVREIVQFLRDLLSLRRRQPGEDLATYLLSARVDSRALNDDELMGIFFLAFTGGLDTVASSTGFFFRHLAENPDQQGRLRNDPSLIPAAVEELFRAFSIVNVTRYATRDTELLGAPIKAGDCVTCLLSLGSRDPAEHSRANTVDFEHEKVRHLAFSAGPHHCVGAPLARREMVIALEGWTQRAPAFRLQAGAQPKAFGPVVLSLDTLPLEWVA